LGSGAAVGTAFSGFVIKDFIGKDFNKGLGISLIFIAIVFLIYFFISQDVKRVPELYQVEAKAPKKKKIKMSMMESFKFLAKSKHLALIATLVLCYGAFMSLFEAVTKAQNTRLAAAVGDDALSKIYGYQGVGNGFLSICFVFMSGWISKRGWRFTASITPIVATICTTIFFVFLFAGDSVGMFFGGQAGAIDVTKILWLTVIFGTVNQVTIKAAKYILFDSTCNQAYIPLDEESKVRGKAAVDGVGSRLGKSFGSFLISAPIIGLYSLFGSINSEKAKLVVAVLIGFILFLWLRSVTKLSRLLAKEERSRI
jgi:AAA family ATP:ADP antiporter